MKVRVKELINLLENENPDAYVYIKDKHEWSSYPLMAITGKGKLTKDDLYVEVG